MHIVKPRVTIGMIGPAHSGKSTILCRLYSKCGIIHQQRELPDYSSSSDPQSYIDLADTLRTEKDRRLTINYPAIILETDDYYCAMINLPGNIDYTNNMIRGIWQANIAVLVVSSAIGEFKQDSESVVKGGTMHFLAISSVLDSL